MPTAKGGATARKVSFTTYSVTKRGGGFSFDVLSPGAEKITICAHIQKKARRKETASSRVLRKERVRKQKKNKSWKALRHNKLGVKLTRSNERTVAGRASSKEVTDGLARAGKRHTVEGQRVGDEKRGQLGNRRGRVENSRNVWW